MRYVTVVTNNEGGCPARIHDSLAAAKDWVRAYLTDSENNPPQDDEERTRMEADLSGLIEDDPHHVQSVRGSDAWKEWVYIAPISEPETP